VVVASYSYSYYSCLLVVQLSMYSEETKRWPAHALNLSSKSMSLLSGRNAELSRHLAFKLKMHLRGLALMYRALPAKSAQEPGPRPPLRSAVLSIELGAVTAVRGAYIRDIRTQDGLTSLMYLGPLPGTAQVTHPSVLWTSMQNSDSTWPSRVQRPSKSDEEWAKEWQGTAVAAAEAARLLMHINGQSLSISERAKAGRFLCCHAVRPGLPVQSWLPGDLNVLSCYTWYVEARKSWPGLDSISECSCMCACS
jgi:hypothetical protein